MYWIRVHALNHQWFVETPKTLDTLIPLELEGVQELRLRMGYTHLKFVVVSNHFHMLAFQVVVWVFWGFVKDIVLTMHNVQEI